MLLCTTKCDSRATLDYKVFLSTCVLQSATQVILCTTKYCSSTTKCCSSTTKCCCSTTRLYSSTTQSTAEYYFSTVRRLPGRRAPRQSIAGVPGAPAIEPLRWPPARAGRQQCIAHGHTGDWTQGLPHAERVWYHYTNCPVNPDSNMSSLELISSVPSPVLAGAQVLLQGTAPALQSTTSVPVCTTKYTPLLLCTTQYYSSTTLPNKVVLVCTTKCYFSKAITTV